MQTMASAHIPMMSAGGAPVGVAPSSYAPVPPTGAALASTVAAPPSSSPPPLTGIATRSLIFDLGGDTIKIGWCGSSTPPERLPNCAVKHKRDTKWLVADQMRPEKTSTTTTVGQSAGKPSQPTVVHKITDYSGLYVRRPHERVRYTHTHARHTKNRTHQSEESKAHTPWLGLFD